jgi:hypothetical protein
MPVFTLGPCSLFRYRACAFYFYAVCRRNEFVFYLPAAAGSLPLFFEHSPPPLKIKRHRLQFYSRALSLSLSLYAPALYVMAEHIKANTSWVKTICIFTLLIKLKRPIIAVCCCRYRCIWRGFNGFFQPGARLRCCQPLTALCESVILRCDFDRWR